MIYRQNFINKSIPGWLAQLFFISLIIQFGISNSNAQSIAPAIINSAGGTSTISGNFFDWSVGEMTLVSTFTSSSIVVSQGVLQPDSLHPTGIENIDNIQNLIVFPNPADDLLTISFTTHKAGSFSYNLTDMSGKIVECYSGNSITGSNATHLNLIGIDKGFYIFEITTETDSGISKNTAFKIEKL